MDYEKQLYYRLKALLEANINNSETLDSEIAKSRKLLILYKNKDKRNLKPFLDVLRDFDVKTNKDTKEYKIRRTDEENGLKKLIYANILYNRFNFTNKEITEVIGCSRAAVKYYLENNEIKKKYNAIRYNAILNQLNEIIDNYEF